MTDIQKYVIISLFERNQINARTLIDALNALVLESVDNVLESLVRPTMPNCENKVSPGHYIKILSIERENKLKLVKIIKEFLGIGLKEAKDLADSLPYTINRFSGSIILPHDENNYFTNAEVSAFLNMLRENVIDESIVELIDA